MTFDYGMHFNPFPSSSWEEFSLQKLDVKQRPPKKSALPACPSELPAHIWGDGPVRATWKRLTGQKQTKVPFTIHERYTEARELIGNGSTQELEKLSQQALGFIEELFQNLGDTSSPSSGEFRGNELVRLTLSPELVEWRDTQHSMGNILPPKGKGLTPASERVLRLFGATEWPDALKMNNSLFGSGIIGMLNGAADVPTMFSNYVTDMVFYYEHGFNHVFPSLEPLLEKSLEDRNALRTLGGLERRESVRVGKQYIQGKIALEEKYTMKLTDLTARIDRRTAQIILFSECSLLGMAGEHLARGFDPAALMSDMVFGSPGSDVIDVGSDLVNSETMNSFLIVADIAGAGVVTEEALRSVYDAYAATSGRIFTQRWYEPSARMCAMLYTWHIQNDRHMFLRRALLGWSKARKSPANPQTEADFDEVFDKEFSLTGVRRPLAEKYACNGEEECDHVQHFFESNKSEPNFKKLWSLLSVEVLDYVRDGKVNERREQQIAEDSRVCMAELFSRGRVIDMVWLLAHVSHHAWQVNYLMEAGMFGSLLDGRELVGKLDREEKKL